MSGFLLALFLLLLLLLMLAVLYCMSNILHEKKKKLVETLGDVIFRNDVLPRPPPPPQRRQQRQKQLTFMRSETGNRSFAPGIVESWSLSYLPSFLGFSPSQLKAQGAFQSSLLHWQPHFCSPAFRDGSKSCPNLLLLPPAL